MDNHALNSKFLAAAGRHLIVASAKGQSVTYFQHVLVIPICQHNVV